MSVVEEPDQPDEFIRWLLERGYFISDRAEHLAEWIEETTGWAGRDFSLSEAERWWIMRANEVIEWLRLYSPTGDQIFLDSALRTLAGMGPIPPSLTIE